MSIKTDLHTIKGMQKDISVSKASNEFAFDALNIRLTAREGNTLLSVTNEKGNKEVPIYDLNNSVIIEGIVIGKEIINNYLVLFTTSKARTINKDRIYRLEKKLDKFDCVELYKGDLNFDFEHPIESIGIFENENIQKVYWVDGINPVRYINIVNTYEDNNNDVFNFAPNLALNETVTIKCDNETKGQFPSGVVQYVFTYYNKYGAESNIFYQSPLVYSHRSNRGGSPEETASNSFTLELKNLETKFDYVRVYSIIRTSIDATPTVKHVIDLSPKSGIVNYIDTNNTGEIIDPTLLLYLGGENIIPECITHKDNTLFLGNYKLKSSTFSEESKEAAKDGKVEFTEKVTEAYEFRESMYDYTTQLNQSSYEITTLKARETYRFGVQFQNKIGRWSEVIFVGDYKVDKEPKANTATELTIPTKQSTVLVKGRYNIPETLLEEARKLGYIKARGVIVYPSGSDRDIICQGVLNPTVFGMSDRYSSEDKEILNNSPYAQSSWFFRPYVKSRGTNDTGTDEMHYGSYATYTDLESVNAGVTKRSIEIGINLKDIYENGTNRDRGYYVDANIVTMHSPDIEFNDFIDSYSDTALSCTIVGYVNINNCKSFRDVQASTAGADAIDRGFYSRFPSNLNPTYIRTGWKSDEGSGRMLISAVNWIGKPIKKSDDSWIALDYRAGWLVSPWQRSGSLINDFAKRPNDQVLSRLKHNRLINTRVSYETVFLEKKITPPSGISNIAVFNSNENSILYIDKYSYYGNVDKVLLPGSNNVKNEVLVGSPVGTTYSISSTESRSLTPNPDDGTEGGGGGGSSSGTSQNTRASLESMYFSSIRDYTDAEGDEDYTYSKDPVSMKYKSTKHVVFQFKSYYDQSVKKSKRVILPSILDSRYPHTKDVDVYYEVVEVPHYSVLWLAELSRSDTSKVKFGGNTPEAILNNRWHIAGNSVNINTATVKVDYLQGDTYFQRYDCMKTYPYTLEDENSVTEILSFFCETQINLDGRYDRNRKNFNNLALTPTNYNLINPVYTQTNNFFNYFTLDPSLKINNFNYSLTWSKEKSLGENIDQWTNITLASTLELDGGKGEITALKTFNNEIFCFQKQGISNILFNSRVQIPTSDGVPIEITNGLKVQGKRYLSSIGCSNKWSIAESPVGLYFIDSNTDEIYLFNGELTSLSTQLGFSSYAKEHNHLNKWNPITFDNFRTHYDKANGDVYFTDKNSCLVYSESIGQFTSFMSYEETPYMFNIDNSFYAIKNNKIWEQFTGDYNSFYGETKPYSITVISNPDSFYDKIFNTVEFRADTWDNDKLLNSTFDTLEVWNEYQHGKSNLTSIPGNPSPLKRKFRVWRANIPRDMSNMRDRIRNTWAYIKLEHSNPSNYKTEFHDLMVHYFI